MTQTPHDTRANATAAPGDPSPPPVGGGRTPAQRFARASGLVYLLVGFLGFVPPAIVVGGVPGATGPLAGLVLGLFASNWLLALIHAFTGARALGSSRKARRRGHGFAGAHESPSAARTYALAVGTGYSALFSVGALTPGVVALGGLLPLNGADGVLHGLTALLAFGAYFASRGRGGTTPQASRTPPAETRAAPGPPPRPRQQPEFATASGAEGSRKGIVVLGGIVAAAVLGLVVLLAVSTSILLLFG